MRVIIQKNSDHTNVQMELQMETFSYFSRWFYFLILFF